MEAFAILVLTNIHVYMLTWYRKLAKSGFAKVLINFGGFGEPSMNKHTCIHTHLISEGRTLRFRPVVQAGYQDFWAEYTCVHYEYVCFMFVRKEKDS